MEDNLSWEKTFDNEDSGFPYYGYLVDSNLDVVTKTKQS